MSVCTKNRNIPVFTARKAVFQTTVIANTICFGSK